MPTTDDLLTSGSDVYDGKLRSSFPLFETLRERLNDVRCLRRQATL
ncbi:MAG: hypothetical protein HWQ38_07800 [Nostoc sp. NMS7]|nr:hypothetical protein [Nostoc sp. NMS7]MBN3946385.1 hypothetical protein [Nostoc sp. NMS7]